MLTYWRGRCSGAKQRGSKLGIPTANLGNIEQLLPADGVYAGWVELGSGKKSCSEHREVLEAECSPLTVPATAMPSVVNIGTRPTVSSDGTRTVEAHVIAQKLGELYGKHIAIFLAQRLRDERKFADIEALRAQINTDITQGQQVLVDKK